MQRALKIVAFSAVAASATEASTAKVWLRAHAAPNQDELAELKGENPDAYAIVKALLTKRSLGLLDPKHPTASFASTAAPAEAAPVGTAAFALSEQDQEAVGKKASAAAPVDEDAYPEIALAPRHHDWLNWKPADSAIDDDSMVKNVLGSVANLVGSKPKQAAGADSDSLAADEASILGEEKSEAPVKVAPILPDTPKQSLISSRSDAALSSPLAADEAKFGGKLAVDVAVAAEEEAHPEKVAPAPVAAAASIYPMEAADPAAGNSYLKNIDFGLKTEAPAVPRASAIQGNSYLRGINFGLDDAAPAAPKPVQSLASQSKDVNYLSSFSWDDSRPQARRQQVEVEAPAAPQPKKTALNSLSSWLSSGSKTPVAAPVVPADFQAPVAVEQRAATPTANPYAMQW
jgi:hypothetical protein